MPIMPRLRPPVSRGRAQDERIVDDFGMAAEPVHVVVASPGYGEAVAKNRSTSASDSDPEESTVREKTRLPSPVSSKTARNATAERVSASAWPSAASARSGTVLNRLSSAAAAWISSRMPPYPVSTPIASSWNSPFRRRSF
jgi:hypothetical protein